MALFFGFLLLVIGIPTWFLFPPREALIPSDVVFVIAGSYDGRHQLGARLVEDGLAENFVVSNPEGAKDAVGAAHCEGINRPKAASGTWCLSPVPSTTTGEALTMGALSSKQKWSSATVVTSRVHARRVKTMFVHCTNLDAEVVYVDYIQKHSVVKELLHEIAGYIKFWVTNPCRNLTKF